MRDDLLAIPKHMADQVRGLFPAVTLGAYQRFLDHMFHYTRGSEDRLLHAAAHAPDEAGDGSPRWRGAVPGTAADRPSHSAGLQKRCLGRRSCARLCGAR